MTNTLGHLLRAYFIFIYNWWYNDVIQWQSLTWKLYQCSRALYSKIFKLSRICGSGSWVDWYEPCQLFWNVENVVISLVSPFKNGRRTMWTKNFLFETVVRSPVIAAPLGTGSDEKNAILKKLIVVQNNRLGVYRSSQAFPLQHFR